MARWMVLVLLLAGSGVCFGLVASAEGEGEGSLWGDLSLEEQIGVAEERIAHWREVLRGLERLRDAKTEAERVVLRVEVEERVERVTPGLGRGRDVGK